MAVVGPAKWKLRLEGHASAKAATAHRIRHETKLHFALPMWELIFMMLILKIPIVYLCLVVYWAVKAEPQPPEPALLPVLPEQPPHGPRPLVARRRPPRRPSRGGPHTPRGGTRRTRTARAIS